MFQTPLQLSISKDKLAEMTAAEFTGEIRVIDNAADARAALRYLAKQPIVGFDTETRPAFRKGLTHTVALVQLSTAHICFLFRINKIGFIEQLRDFLSTKSVLKIGLSIKDDFHGLHKLGQFDPAGFVELQDYVREFGIVDASLQRVYAIIFNRRISKGQRLTNWEAQELTPAQQHYAALDAYACLRIYETLTAGIFDPAASPYRLEPQPEPDQASETERL